MMKIETTTFDDHSLIVLKGDFQTDEVKQLLAAIKQLREAGEARFALSLRFVKYVNSTALGSLLKLRKALNDHEGDVVIVRPSPVTREVIEGLGLEELLPMYDDEQLAIRHLTEGVAQPTRSRTSDASEDEPGSVMFSFDDDRGNLLPGRTTRGVATLTGLNTQDVTFRWDGASHDVDADGLRALFPEGSSIHVKFREKLIRKEYFNLDALIRSVDIDDAGVATVTARWKSLPTEDRTALAQHAKNLALFDKHTSN